MFPRDRGFIFSNVAHTTILKETSSLLRFHFQRRSLSCRSKLIQVSRWPSGRFGCPLCLRRSAMAKRKSGGCRFSKFFYEQRVRICFQSHQNTRAAQKIKLNGKCIRHSGVFVWNGVWFFARFCPTCARRCHFCMGIITNHVIWIVYLIKINYVTIYTIIKSIVPSQWRKFLRQYFSSLTRGIGHMLHIL